MNKLFQAQSMMRSRQFLYGVATASFQIEGGAEARRPSIWDTFCQQPGKIKDGSDGLVACDHFHRWQQDIELLAEMGVDAYRLSLSWPRLLDEQGQLDTHGADFYQQLIDGLLAKNIKPFVTLYHWDLPQSIEDKGGWLNRDSAYRFADYADQVSRLLGDRVESFATLNEPFCSAYLGYELGIHAPGLNSRNYGKKAAHHLLLGHGLAMQALQANSPQTMNGIVLNFTPCYPATESSEDKAAAQKADQHFNQWFIQPLMEARYPQVIETLPDSEKPDIKAGDMEIISQPLDFLGVNFYTRGVYQASESEQRGFVELPAAEPKTAIGWQIYPQAFHQLLTDLDARYQLPPIYITENGAAMDDKLEQGRVDDQGRIDYVEKHLVAVDRAISEGVDIRGYFCWSFMDNFEWAEGYSQRFGLVWVDYQTQQRTLKQSGYFYQSLLASRED